MVWQTYLRLTHLLWIYWNPLLALVLYFQHFSPPFSFPSASCNVGLKFKVNYSVLQIVLDLFLKQVPQKHSFHPFLICIALEFSYPSIESLALHFQILLPSFFLDSELCFSFPTIEQHCLATRLSRSVFLAFLDQTSFLNISKLVKKVLNVLATLKINTLESSRLCSHGLCS